MKKTTCSSDFICMECGNDFPMARISSVKREKYHIKDLFCPICNKTTKFIELKNKDITKKELEFKPQLTEFEQHLYDLLNIENKENERQRVFK